MWLHFLRAFVVLVILIFCNISLVLGQSPTPSKLVFIGIQFQDSGLPPSKSDIQSTLFSGPFDLVKGVQEASEGVVAIDPSFQYVGPITVSTTSADCLRREWLSEAKNLIQSQGTDLSQYSYIVFVLPKTPVCSFGGTADINGKESFLGDLRAAYHELGHSFGMGHAATDFNDDGVYDSEGGDPTCVMGDSPYNYDLQMNAAHPTRRQWIQATGEQIPHITGPSIHQYEVRALEAGGNGMTRVITVDPGFDDELIVSYRTVASLVPQIGAQVDWRNKVFIHKRKKNLDLHTRLIRALGVGESYTDPISRADFKIDAVNPQSALVTITLLDQDTDGDGIPDSMDPDDDNDGVEDSHDCAPKSSGGVFSSLYPDSDDDGVRESIVSSLQGCFGANNPVPVGYTPNESQIDNCPNVSNTSQSDANGDGVGDACTPTPVPPTLTPTPLPLDGVFINLTQSSLVTKKKSMVVQGTIASATSVMRIMVRARFGSEKFPKWKNLTLKGTVLSISGGFGRSWQYTLRTPRKGRYTVQVQGFEGKTKTQVISIKVQRK